MLNPLALCFSWRLVGLGQNVGVFLEQPSQSPSRDHGAPGVPLPRIAGDHSLAFGSFGAAGLLPRLPAMDNLSSLGTICSGSLHGVASYFALRRELLRL